jgi:hypothetical protein
MQLLLPKGYKRLMEAMDVIKQLSAATKSTIDIAS